MACNGTECNIGTLQRCKGRGLCISRQRYGESEHRFMLAGLDISTRYHLHFQDGTAPDRTATGSELMNEGLLVRLQNPLSSELVFLTEEAKGQ